MDFKNGKNPFKLVNKTSDNSRSSNIFRTLRENVTAGEKDGKGSIGASTSEIVSTTRMPPTSVDSKVVGSLSSEKFDRSKTSTTDLFNVPIFNIASSSPSHLSSQHSLESIKPQYLVDPKAPQPSVATTSSLFSAGATPSQYSVSPTQTQYSVNQPQQQSVGHTLPYNAIDLTSQHAVGSRPQHIVDFAPPHYSGNSVGFSSPCTTQQHHSVGVMSAQNAVGSVLSQCDENPLMLKHAKNTTHPHPLADNTPPQNLEDPLHPQISVGSSTEFPTVIIPPQLAINPTESTPTHTSIPALPQYAIGHVPILQGAIAAPTKHLLFTANVEPKSINSSSSALLNRGMKSESKAPVFTRQSAASPALQQLPTSMPSSTTTVTSAVIGSQLPSAIFGGVQASTSGGSSKAPSYHVPSTQISVPYIPPNSSVTFGSGQVMSNTAAPLFSSTASSVPAPRIFGGTVTSAKPKQNVFGRYILNPVTRASYMKPTTLSTSTSQANVGSISSVMSDPITRPSALSPNSISTLGLPAPVFSPKLRNSVKGSSANIFGGVPSHVSAPTDPLKGRHSYSRPIPYHVSSKSSQGNEKEDKTPPGTPLDLHMDKIVTPGKHEKDSRNSKEKPLRDKNNTTASPAGMARSGSEPLDLSDRTNDFTFKLPDKCHDSSLAVPEVKDELKKGSTIVIAVEIPQNYLNKSVLQNHFNKFGKVNKVVINQKSSQASIYFNDHTAAAAAKLKGKKLHPLIPEMKLFFGAQPQSKESTSVKKPQTGSRETSQILTRVTPQTSSRVASQTSSRVASQTSSRVASQTSSRVASQTSSRVASQTVNRSASKSGRGVTPLNTSNVNPLTASRVITPSASHTTSQTVSRVTSRVNANNPFSITRRPQVKEPKNSESKPEKDEPVAVIKKSEVRNKAPTGNIASIKDLSVLMNSQAHNNYDKFLILDARDKSMRMKQKKELDVNKAVYLLAACPDMCPEKERYSRDIQYDVSSYEMTDGEIDHKLSVKKFSRSSADKDEPLPHELRPGPVLKMTMDFLVCNIIEKGDKENVQLDVWYNYLCNRTRALRNDIMQQHLVDHHAVYVLEKCTRFHIHCSHHLCEEPPDLFDSKMNTEHLTKSLQSLKELYHDLGEKGVYYESEAEFRAYEIILNVNDGNIIFKYLQFRDPIRNSREVQFAIKVLHSIHANNYIKFFKLLRKATYLQACIMHRYFTTLRLKALNIIVKAYSLPNKLQFLPIEEMMTKLGFSTEKNFQNYIKHFGLSVNDNCKISINKNKFLSKPENLPPTHRALEITQKKSSTSIGVIVQGGPLPTNPLLSYSPHNSFNEKGFLKKTALDASDQCVETKYVDEITISPNETLSTDDFAKELTLKLNKMLQMRLMNKYFDTWLNFAKMHKQKRAQLDEESKILIAKRIFKKWKIKTSESIKLKKKADQYILSKYFCKWRNYTFKVKELDELRKRIKELTNKALLRRVFNCWREKASKKSLERKLNLLRCQVLTRKCFIKWHLHTLASISIAEENSDLHYNRSLIKKYFCYWQNWISHKKNRKDINFKDFPAVGCLLPVETQNELLNWGYNRKRSLNMSATQISEIDNNIHVKFRKHCSLKKLSGIIAWTALPLLQRFQSDIHASPPDFSGNIFSYCFKILILIEPDTDPYLIEWVKVKFNILETDNLTAPLQSKSKITSHRNGVTYTIIVAEKELQLESKCDLDGASLIVLVFNESELENVECKVSEFGTVPYLILCGSLDTNSYQNNMLLLTKEAIDNPFTSEKLFDSIFQFWKDRSKICCLQTSKLHELVSGFISQNVLGPAYNVVSQRLFYEQAFLSPTQLVSFYNAALTHLIDCLNMAEAIAGDGPPSEAFPEIPLKRRTSENRNDIIFAMKNAFLPNFSINHDVTFNDLDEKLAKYISSVVGSDEWGGNLFAEINKIFKNTEMQAIMNEEYSDSREVSMVKLPWMDIINCCIFYKLSYIPDIDVFYDINKLKAFDTQPWIMQIKLSKLVTNRAKNVESSENLSAVKRKGSSPPHESEPATKQKRINSCLLQDLQDEKLQAIEFEKKLKALMDEGEQLHKFTQNDDTN